MAPGSVLRPATRVTVEPASLAEGASVAVAVAVKDHVDARDHDNVNDEWSLAMDGSREPPRAVLSRAPEACHPKLT
jgi:hypothetical protein